MTQVTLMFIKQYSSPEQAISELLGAVCHMGSHSVTCHPDASERVPSNTSHMGWYSNNLLREGWKAELTYR